MLGVDVAGVGVTMNICKHTHLRYLERVCTDCGATFYRALRLPLGDLPGLCEVGRVWLVLPGLRAEAQAGGGEGERSSCPADPGGILTVWTRVIGGGGGSTRRAMSPAPRRTLRWQPDGLRPFLARKVGLPPVVHGG